MVLRNRAIITVFCLPKQQKKTVKMARKIVTWATNTEQKLTTEKRTHWHLIHWPLKIKGFRRALCFPFFLLLVLVRVLLVAKVATDISIGAGWSSKRDKWCHPSGNSSNDIISVHFIAAVEFSSGGRNTARDHLFFTLFLLPLHHHLLLFLLLLLLLFILLPSIREADIEKVLSHRRAKHFGGLATPKVLAPSMKWQIHDNDQSPMVISDNQQQSMLMGRLPYDAQRLPGAWQKFSISSSLFNEQYVVNIIIILIQIKIKY